MPITTSDNYIKERLSIAYVTAVAARAGCQIAKFDIDKQSIDAIVKPVSGAKLQIDLQLKATGATDVLKDGEVVIDLPIKNYEDLSDPVSTVPHYLIVLALPADSAVWLSLSEDALLMKGCAYWHDLRGMPKSYNDTSQRVRFSRSQQFNPDALRDMMTKAKGMITLPSDGPPL
jgi:hypothetical protein